MKCSISQMTQLVKITQENIRNLNRSKTNKEIELVIIKTIHKENPRLGLLYYEFYHTLKK